MILVAIGANLPNPVYGPPLSTCKAVIPALERAGLRVTGCSRWYESAPVPASSQPWYVNGVVAVATTLDAMEVLTVLLDIEAAFGRRRGQRNAARTLDLDLIAYNDRVIADETGEHALIVPHPRLQDRAFVLRPLADVAPQWRHPKSGVSVDQLIADLENPGSARPITE